MTTLQEQIREDLKTAMKNRDKQRTGTLRMLVAALVYQEREGAKHELDDAETLKIIAREIKKRRESAQVYAENGREELAAQEQLEADIMAEYQPKQLDDAELAALVTAAIEEAGPDAQMGPVMKAAQAKAAGRVDGKRLSTAVREALAK